MHIHPQNGSSHLPVSLRRRPAEMFFRIRAAGKIPSEQESAISPLAFSRMEWYTKEEAASMPFPEFVTPKN